MTVLRARIVRIALPLAGVALVLSACGSSSTDDEASVVPAPASSAVVEDAESVESEVVESEVVESEAPASTAGAYISLADYESNKGAYSNSDIVLFFNAAWCSTCKEARENLEADPAAIPAGLTIVTVDFDDSDELKRKYGVTVQHTFVQVDAEGNEITKWNGSVTADQIAQQLA
jgi:thiol-disulfide isomerase/thioredoxin